MYVKLCWKSKDTKKGTINVSKEMTIKEAKKVYKEQVEEIATVAYLRYWDGWRTRIHKTLKTN